MTTIRDETQLPTPTPDAPGFRYYVRSKSDPRYLIAGHTGVVYLRLDGERWEWPGYWFEMDRAGKVEMRLGSTWFDDVTYQPTHSFAAA